MEEEEEDICYRNECIRTPDVRHEDKYLIPDNFCLSLFHLYYFTFLYLLVVHFIIIYYCVIISVKYLILTLLLSESVMCGSDKDCHYRTESRATH